jgi:hypothetical protein
MQRLIRIYGARPVVIGVACAQGGQSAVPILNLSAMGFRISSTFSSMKVCAAIALSANP